MSKYDTLAKFFQQRSAIMRKLYPVKTERTITMFQSITLWTREGDLVADITIPKFNPPAEVLTWGSRTFIRNAAGEYREGMNFFVPPYLERIKSASVPSCELAAPAAVSQPDGHAETRTCSLCGREIPPKCEQCPECRGLEGRREVILERMVDDAKNKLAIAQSDSETKYIDVFDSECKPRPEECTRIIGRDRPERVTLSGRPPELPEDSAAPAPIEPATGQHRDYWVLSAEERAKGFVRPVRHSYRHLRCGTITSMGHILAETYARDPKFYGATMCVTCRSHFPLIETDASKAAFEAKDGFRRAFIWIEEDRTEKEGVGE